MFIPRPHKRTSQHCLKTITYTLEWDEGVWGAITQFIFMCFLMFSSIISSRIRISWYTISSTVWTFSSLAYTEEVFSCITCVCAYMIHVCALFYPCNQPAWICDAFTGKQDALNPSKTQHQKFSANMFGAAETRTSDIFSVTIKIMFHQCFKQSKWNRHQLTTGNQYSSVLDYKCIWLVSE